MLTTDTIPFETVQAVLRERLADPSVRLTGVESEPLPVGGFSGNQLLRVRLAWKGQGAAGGSGSADWVLKRWLPGGHSERLLGIDQPLEALAWEGGLLRPESLPPGVSTPIVGARLDPDGRSAWIVMEDVSEALGRYNRAAPLPPTEAVARAKLVLDGLARLHAWSERPEQQARLTASPWLVPMERFLWSDAARCAAVLGRAAPARLAPGCPVTDEYRADVAALLGWIPKADRALFADLMCNRESLVRALVPFPRTLIHGDAGDRNLGLRPARAGAAFDAADLAGPDLVMIDWEWIGTGVPALDVARIWAGFPGVCDLSQPCPDAVFSDELLAFYLDRYRTHGGAPIDPRSWHQVCALTALVLGMTQLSFFGSVIRMDVKPILAVMERQFDAFMGAARPLLVA